VSPATITTFAAIPGPSVIGTSRVAPSVVITTAQIPAPTVFGGAVGVPVKGPTQTRAIGGPNQGVLVGSGANSTEAV
jgi:hypothetical protein